MAEEIVQVIGIDVTQAIAAVGQLQAKLDGFGASLTGLSTKLSTFNTTARKAFDLGNVNAQLGKTTQLLDQFGNPIPKVNAATNAIKKVGTTSSDTNKKVKAAAAESGNALKRFATDAVKRIGALSVGFSTFARIVSTQIIVRGISAIQRALSDSVRSASEFQLQISEIQTISQNAFATFDKAATAVRNLSDSFNLPLGEVGEGLYQVISNQIKGAANQMDVMRESAILAKVGVADFGDTVSLVTGTINAFELSQNSAARVSSIFFETVRLGRTRIGELANSFGTVATLANETGASVEELAAAFATLTIKGINTAKAATQIRGVFNAILKPTTEMAKVLRDAGFASGESAVKSIGFVGAVRLIEEAADGSASKLAKLVPRIRGMTGAMILGQDAANNFGKSLETISSVSQDLTKEKLEIRIETDAERVEREINKLSNALTVDLGQSILSAIRKFLEFTNVSTNAVTVVKALAPPLIFATGALVAYAGVAGVTALLNTKLAQSFLGVAAGAKATKLGVAGAITGLAGLGFAIALGISEAAKASGKAAIEQIRRDIDRARTIQLIAVRQVRSEQLNETKAGIRDRFLAVSNHIAKVTALLTKRTDAFKIENAKILDDTKRVFQAIQDVNRTLLSDLSSERQSANKAALSADKRIGQARIQLSDTLFSQENKRFSAIQKSSNLEERAVIVARQGASALAKARTDEQIQAALATIARADGFAQEAAAAAQQSGNLVAIRNVEKTITSIIERRISAEEKQVQLQNQRAAKLKEVEKQERARVVALGQAVTLATKLAEQLKLGTGVDRKAVQKDFNAALKEVSKLSRSATGKIDVSNIFALADFEKNLREVSQQFTLEGIDVTNILDGVVFDNFERRLTETVLRAFNFGALGALKGGASLEDITKARDAIDIGDPEGSLARLAEIIPKTRDAELKRVESIEAAKRVAEEYETSQSKLNATMAKGPTILESGVESVSNFFQGVVDAINALSEHDPFATPISVQEGRGALRSFQKEVIAVPGQLAGASPEEVQLRLLELQQAFTQFVESLPFLVRGQLTSELTKTNSLIDAAVEDLLKARELLQQGTEAPAEAAEAMKVGVEGANNAASNMVAPTSSVATNTSSAATFANIMADGYERAALASANIQAPSTATAAIGRFFPKFLAGGGFSPQGTDTIPAMLSPGEFVMNAKSTRRFFSQLQAMNAGVQPIYRQDGGTVTNVGDINVTVSGGQDSGNTGRKIAASLRRELRRGTSSL